MHLTAFQTGTIQRTIGVLVIICAALWTVSSPASAAPDRASRFMQEAANALIRAQRTGTPEAFARVIKKYGHVPAIGTDALGDYRNRLDRKIRKPFYNGLVKFISRYAAAEGRKYPVARAEFPSPGIRDGRHVLVDSRVILTDGSFYNVRWMLVPRGRSFRVRDAQVIGFWVSPFLTRLFENYIADNGGRIEALVIALNR